MATYVVLDDTGRILHRHLRATCPTLVEAARLQGRKVGSYWGKNTRSRGQGDESTRCPLCFFDGGPIEALRGVVPRWLATAERADYAPRPGHGFVYEIIDPEWRAAVVGSTRHPAKRLRSHWRAATTQRGIPWLYDRLSEDPGFEPELVLTEVAEADLKRAEDDRRNDLRAAGWEVATDF